MSSEAFAAALAALALVALVLVLWVATLDRRLARALQHYERLRQGVDGQRLDQVLEAHISAARDAARTAQEALARTDDLAADLRRALQRAAVVRFNPFDDTGGDQSFVIAVTNADGDGFILSSLHGRAGTRVYAKPLRGGTSRYPLSDEESRALLEAGLTAARSGDVTAGEGR